MVNKIGFIENDHIQVAYNYTLGVVTVMDKKSQQSWNFAGWDSLYDMFLSFWRSFSEHILYNDAVEYFTPNIANTIIHAAE